MLARTPLELPARSSAISTSCRRWTLRHPCREPLFAAGPFLRSYIHAIGDVRHPAYIPSFPSAFLASVSFAFMELFFSFCGCIISSYECYQRSCFRCYTEIHSFLKDLACKVYLSWPGSVHGRRPLGAQHPCFAIVVGIKNQLFYCFYFWYTGDREVLMVSEHADC